jgi:thiamine transport system permease protein
MRNGSTATYVVMALPLLLLMGFLVFPVLGVLILGLVVGPGSSFQDVMNSQVTHATLWFTFLQAAASTILAVVLGLPGAFLLARLEFKGKQAVRAAVILPFILPPIVVVVGFLRMFGSYGFVDSVAMALTGATESVVNLAAGVPGIVLAHAFYNIPLVILLVSAALERLDSDIEDTAELLGASSIQKLRRIVLPHVMPSLLSAAILTFLFCFMSFPIVLALGQGRYMTLEVLIYYAFTSFIKTVSPGELSRPHLLGGILYALLIGVIVVGPMIAVIDSAVYDPVTGQYTLKGFLSLLEVEGGLLPLANSLFYATLATLFSVVMGIPLAYSLRSRSSLLSNSTSVMILLPLGVSSITVAYGLLRFIAVPTGWAANPWPLIIIAQTLIGVPFTARAIESSLRSIDPALADQADSLGASRLQKLFFVELPLLAPGILVGAAFAFAMAIGEMSATLFLKREQNVTLAVTIYENLGVRRFVEAGAASLLLLVVCFIAFLVIQRASESAFKGAI